MISVVNSAPNKVFSFVRFGAADGVLAVLNLSPETQNVTFKDTLHHGAYIDYFSGEAAEFTSETDLTLSPWGFRIYRKR